ncbi:MAG: DUF5686 family protein [Lentimicrobiaceae bacterium]|nr:DUF5686 family protein [Lentimicrobiaceae bacterium]
MLKKISIFLLFYTLFLGISYSQTLDTLRGILREVEVKTKHNPAIPIIKKAIQSRNENGQFANPHFTYTSYQKMLFTGDFGNDSLKINTVLQLTDSLSADTVTLSKKDSSYLRTVEFFEKHHLFFMESVTKNYFKKPATLSEKVVAHRTAGLKDPIVSIYLAKLQTVNFYQNDIIEIIESPYINPISVSAITIYDFRLEEKIIQNEDTLFVISFKPKKNAHFKSLTGKIWISSRNYAFNKIEVEPFEKAFGMKFSLIQEYESQLNHTWFLKNMFVRVEPSFIEIRQDSMHFVQPVIISEKRITEIDYDTRLRARDFGFADIDEDLEDEITQEKLLETYRPTPITDQEKNTLILIDSIAEPFKLDKKLESLKIITTGKIPFSILNFDITQLIFFNSTETVRLGLGVYTNDRLSKVVNFGGFFGYGFKDKKWKWGGELGFNIIRSRDCKITFQYYSNLIESGETHYFNRDYTLFSGEFYRSWLFEHFYRSNAIGVTVQSKITRWLTGYISSFYSTNKTLFNYNFQDRTSNDALLPYTFDDFYVKVGARLAFQEKYWGADKYYYYSVSPFPVIIAQYTRGIKGVINSGFNYNRIDLKVTYRKNWKILGFTNITVFAGIVDRALPCPLLLNQRAGYYPIGLDGADHFGTMRADEFLSDKYVTLFIRHNFGRMTQNKKFSPRIVVCQGIGFGGLKNPEIHFGINYKTMEKGYFESGLMINDLLVIKGLLSFGIGAFVRYGEYYLPKPQYKTIDNFSFKVNFRVPFER